MIEVHIQATEPHQGITSDAIVGILAAMTDSYPKSTAAACTEHDYCVAVIRSGDE